MKWISVKDQKPETDKKVLGYCGGDDVGMMFFDGEEFIGIDGCRNEFVSFWAEIPYPPRRNFSLLDRIVTTSDSGSRDWSLFSQARQRRWGVSGTIVGRSDAHGLCFEVIYDDGGYDWFEPEELELKNG